MNCGKKRIICGRNHPYVTVTTKDDGEKKKLTRLMGVGGGKLHTRLVHLLQSGVIGVLTGLTRTLS